MLIKMGFPRVILDSRPVYKAEVPIPCKKPALPVSFELTGDIAFVRYFSHPEKSQNSHYMTEWAEVVQSYLDKGSDVYFFVHCPQEEHTPALTKLLYEIFIANGLNIPAPRWESAPPFPRQGALF